MKKENPWDWLEFREPAYRRGTDALFIRLAPTHGEIYMNLRTYEVIGSPPAFVLFFNPKTETIGLKPAKVEVENAVIVREMADKNYRVIRVRPFLHRHKIYFDRTMQFPKAYIDDNGLICLGLRDRVAIRKPVKSPFMGAVVYKDLSEQPDRSQ
ncbi:MAG: hypothetical protein QM785_15785 [Pyrinomonadaceae bacterium]